MEDEMDVIERRGTDEDKLNRVFRALSDDTRRRLLMAVYENERVPYDYSDSDDIELLIHSHIPNLVQKGYVSWDRDEETITRGPYYGEIRPILVLMDRHGNILPYEWTEADI